MYMPCDPIHPVPNPSIQVLTSFPHGHVFPQHAYVIPGSPTRHLVTKVRATLVFRPAGWVKSKRNNPFLSMSWARSVSGNQSRKSLVENSGVGTRQQYSIAMMTHLESSTEGVVERRRKALGRVDEEALIAPGQHLDHAGSQAD